MKKKEENGEKKIYLFLVGVDEKYGAKLNDHQKHHSEKKLEKKKRN